MVKIDKDNPVSHFRAMRELLLQLRKIAQSEELCHCGYFNSCWFKNQLEILTFEINSNVSQGFVEGRIDTLKNFTEYKDFLDGKEFIQ